MFYSPSKKGFYNQAIHGSAIPADAVEIPAEVHAQLLTDQSQGAIIQPDDNGYPVAVFPPPPSLDQIKADLWDKIKAERDRRKENGGYPAAGKWFHSDVYSRTQILAFVQLGANLPVDVQWKTMDGTFLLLSPTILGQMFQAAIAQDNATFKAAEVHKAAMESSADPGSYDYSTGWPAIYGG